MSLSLRGGRRRHRRVRSHRRGGNPVGAEVMKAAVPFGLFALSNYLGKKKSRKSTKKGMRRKTARRAFMSKKK